MSEKKHPRPAVSDYMKSLQKRNSLVFRICPDGSSGYVVGDQLVHLPVVELLNKSNGKGNYRDNPSKYIY